MSYLMNCWYAAGYARELDETPLARTLLDMPVVFFRDSRGAPAALADRCPHRFVPLSRGAVIGDALQCAYHGLRFGRDGACVYNPHYDALPRAARVRSFPVIERYGLLWFWPGDAEAADPARLPDFGFLDRPDYRTVSGYLRVAASYQLIVDNLLDLSHAPFLHPAFAVPGISAEERLRQTQSELIRDGDRIIAKRSRPNAPPNAPTREIFGFTDARMDARSHMHWFAPALLHFDLGSAPVGGAEVDGLCIPALHAISPETRLTSHYFFAQARNVLPDDPKVDAALLDMLDTAFRTEDEPVIEAQQLAMGDATELDELDPVLLKTDAAPIAARRVLARLIAAERARTTTEIRELEKETQ